MNFREPHRIFAPTAEGAPPALPAASREEREEAGEAGTEAPRTESLRTESPAARLRRVVEAHYDALWRTLRYLGVPDAGVDDAAQQALCVLARRLGDITPGAEMAFLFATAIRVASDVRRAARRNRSEPVQNIDTFLATAPGPDELIDQRRAREVLEQVLEAIPIDLRVVFVLFEIEELGLAEVAALLEIPVGTVSSRLRRARESFQAIVRRREAAQRGAAQREAAQRGPARGGRP
jgi:RNA polymerase sigma-70 factor (ECF subfamily)